MNEGLTSAIKNMDMNSKERFLKFASELNTRSQDSLTAAVIKLILYRYKKLKKL